MAKKLTSTKARKILHDKEVHGHPLTEQQRKFFGAIAGGAKPYKAESGGWLDKFDAPQAQNGIEGTMGGLTDKGFNYNGAWGGAWRDGGSLLKAQTGDEFTPYSRNYLNNFRNEWIATYNKPIPYRIPRDDRFDEFYHEKVNTIPQYYKTIPAWVKGLGTDMEEYREGDKNIPPKSMGKLAKGYEWVENYRTGPFRDDSQIREYARLIRSIRNAESRKPVWNRDVKFNFKSGGILQPPMAGADQTVPMYAMGGSIPGAVGFTYARTQSPAPANGPYAKKTKASAQNGQEMKYYQEGLDFKPKTIRQDGSNIPVDPMGYWNPENVGNPVTIPSNVITMEGVDQPLLGISDTGDVQYMEPGEDYEFDGEYVTEYPMAQAGKRVPIVVSDPNDPRLRAYQDSLRTYNNYYNKYLPGGIKAVNESRSIGEADKKFKEIEKLYINTKLATRFYPHDASTLLARKTFPGGRQSFYRDAEFKKPVQPVILEEEPKFEKPIPIPRDTRDLGYTLPTPGQFTAPKLYKYNPDTPTKFSFTYPTGGYNEQKTMYFPTKSAWKSFVEGIKGTEKFKGSQEGVDYAQATGYLKDGGNINDLDAQPIEKLDQLLNFTNYNKPTKGGWLDKYN